MRIRIEDIPARGRTLRLDQPGAADRETVGAALDGEVQALEGELRVERERRGITVHATGAAVVVRPCDRCGAAVELTVHTDERLHYQPPEPSRAGEVELSEGELDVGFLQDGGIDTDDALSEAFALAAPRRVTCGADACPDPASLGDRQDDDVAGHPAFRALKDLF